MDPVPSLNAPHLFINRELSLLEFNQRVLELADDASLPPLERLRFLCISSNNLDEFFEIRVAGLKQLVELGGTRIGADAMPIAEQLNAIHDRAATLIGDQYTCLNERIMPVLARHGVRLPSRDQWTQAQRAWLENYFHNEVEPVLSPLGLDPARPFPRIQNKSLNFIIQLVGKDAFGRDTDLAILQVPRSLPRVVPVPQEGAGKTFVLLSNIVAEFVALLFPGMEVHGCFPFRVTRNSDLFVDDEEVDDLRRALEGELAHRRYGASVRLETSVNCPAIVARFPAGAIRTDAAGSVSCRRSGQPQSPVRGVRTGAATGPQVRAFRAGVAGQSHAGHQSVRAAARRRRAAAPALPGIRAGAGFPAPCRWRSAGAGHQADPVSHRL